MGYSFYDEKMPKAKGAGPTGKPSGSVDLVGPGGRESDGESQTNPKPGVGKRGDSQGPLFRESDGGKINDVPAGAGGSGASGPFAGPLGRSSDGGKINADGKIGAMKRRLSGSYSDVK